MKKSLMALIALSLVSLANVAFAELTLSLHVVPKNILKKEQSLTSNGTNPIVYEATTSQSYISHSPSSKPSLAPDMVSYGFWLTCEVQSVDKQNQSMVVKTIIKQRDLLSIKKVAIENGQYIETPDVKEMSTVSTVTIGLNDPELLILDQGSATYGLKLLNM